MQAGDRRPDRTPVDLRWAPAAGPAGSIAADPEVQRQLMVAFESAPVGMTVTTEDGELVLVNAALAELLGYPQSDLLGRTLEDLTDPETAQQINAGRRQMLHSVQARHTTGSQLARADGHVVPVTLTCARVPATEHSDGCLVVHVQDATDQHAAQAELTRRALHDPLTGLPNRVLLLDRLDRALAGLASVPSSVAVLFADLDGFKTINDAYGHAAGDQVLRAVAARLQQLQRPADTVCRLGGDEFVVLCEDSGKAQADSVAARIQHALATPIRWAAGPTGPTGAPRSVVVRLTASIGIAATSDPAVSAEQLLHDADTAMYRAKQHKYSRAPQQQLRG